MTEGRRPRIGILGLLSWDRLLVVPTYPPAGAYRTVLSEHATPGGAAGNLAVALSRVGASVTLVARVGDDADGEALVAGLGAEPGIDLVQVTARPGEPTDRCTIVVSADPPDRTIFWHPGAAIAHRDPFDLAGLFAHDVTVIDVADHRMRRWLTDLPAHSSPRTRLLGTTTFLVEAGAPVESDAFEVALRFDTLVGNDEELAALTGQAGLDATTATLRSRMVGSNLRTAVISLGAGGCRVCTRSEVLDVPAFAVEAIDPTGAGDAFAAGIAWGMARRWPWERTARLGNALGALATTAYGAQAGVPGRDAVAALVGQDAASLFDGD